MFDNYDPYSSHERTGGTAPDSAGLNFGPAAGPEATDPDDPDCARIYDLIFDTIFFVTGWTGNVDSPSGTVLP